MRIIALSACKFPILQVIACTHFFLILSSCIKQFRNKISLPWEMYPFFSELPLPMNRVFTRLVLDHLHTFSLLTLFMTVFGYHVQLTNSILKEKSEHRMYSLNFCQTFKPIIFMYCSNVMICMYGPFFSL